MRAGLPMHCKEVVDSEALFRGGDSDCEDVAIRLMDLALLRVIRGICAFGCEKAKLLAGPAARKLRDYSTDFLAAVGRKNPIKVLLGIN
jgi:hypothetical protein